MTSKRLRLSALRHLAQYFLGDEGTDHMAKAGLALKPTISSVKFMKVEKPSSGIHSSAVEEGREHDAYCQDTYPRGYIVRVLFPSIANTSSVQ